MALRVISHVWREKSNKGNWKGLKDLAKLPFQEWKQKTVFKLWR